MLELWKWAAGLLAFLLWGVVSWTVYRQLKQQAKTEHTVVANAEAGLFQDSESRLLDIIQRYPQHSMAYVYYARIASNRADWPEALARWADVRARFPKLADGYLGGIEALLRTGDRDQADALCNRAIKKGLKAFWIHAQWAMAADRRADRPEAVRRWSIVRQKFPDEPASYAMSATALRANEQHDEAEALLRSAIAQFPVNPEITAQLARIVHERQQWEEAAALWERLRAMAPRNRDGFVQGAIALNALGRHDEAEELQTGTSQAVAADTPINHPA